MPQITPITVNDRAATPVAHTYTPQNLENGVATFFNSDGIPVGDQKLTVKVKRNPKRVSVSLVFADPVVVTETINGVDRPAVDRTAYANIEFNFAATSTLQERKDLVGKVEDALGSDQSFIDEVLTQLKGMY